MTLFLYIYLLYYLSIFRHILPRSLINDSFAATNEVFETSLYNSSKPVFVYMHGNSGNRASSHRLELYKLFQDLDYHIVCFDYRSMYKDLLY